MDEPTGAMDPVTRQSIWKIIKRMKQGTNTAIILVTHQLDEAEVLSDRIGIMAEGNLRAIGTPAHLRQKYVSGYDIMIKSYKTDSKVILKFLLSIFPSAVLRREVRGTMIFKVIQNIESLASLFRIIEAQKEILCIQDYSISKVNFEQVFLRFASENYDD